MLTKTLSIFFIVISSFACAQEQGNNRNTINPESVVRGEDGMVYTYKVWNKLMQTGNYALKNRNTLTENGQKEYMIVELKESEKAAYFERMPKPKPSAAFVIDETFNGVKVTDINGKKHDLKNLAGKTLVLNFWFVDGSVSNMQIPQLNNLHQEFGDNDSVIMISFCNNSKDEIIAFLKNTPFQFNVVADARALAKNYNVDRYPTTIVVDKNNQIKFSSVGLSPSTGYWIKKAVDESLAH
ncbi:peroxiredoxin family protein [Pedobacter sandarakinus]|uniref:peroxiredoxin family protein n=1 Tax=Pedobacter sandarakinus TaxID=353156 RepID=UPI0022468F79|nr:TlpA disulfide reductase family protein [Pedobacter sandarakinus]MCX2574336.1 TlpA disulfide reductase family protein [Pedobacter sandarakinus]